jgi:GNAT superfamily N-acetyltransferase
VVVIEALDLLGRARESAVVQAAALGPVPSDRLAVLARHAGYPNFAAYGAFDADSLVGYVYGARCEAGQWWFDQISPALRHAGHGAWLVDAHAVTELHVLPSHQGRGIGFGLIQRLLGEVAAPRVLLSTYDNESAARRFYRRLGFVELVGGFRFEVTPQPFALLGSVLPLPALTGQIGPAAVSKSGNAALDRPTLEGQPQRG